MRDDIHKTAPVPRAWKALTRACTNEAAFLKEGAVRAERAIATLIDGKDLQNVKRVLRTASDGDHELLGRQDALDSLARGGKITGLAGKVLENMRQGLSEVEAVHEAVTEKRDSFVREIEGHVKRYGEASAFELRMFRQRLDVAASASLDRVVDATVRGSRVPIPRAPNGPLGGDEEL